MTTDDPLQACSDLKMFGPTSKETKIQGLRRRDPSAVLWAYESFTQVSKLPAHVLQNILEENEGDAGKDDSEATETTGNRESVKSLPARLGLPIMKRGSDGSLEPQKKKSLGLPIMKRGSL